MSHIPKKAFVIYSPISPNCSISNVDQVTSMGCSGQIALESNKELSNVVLELLGLYGGGNDIKSTFESRFNDMTLAIISNSPSTTDIAIQLDCHHESIRSIEQITKLTGFDVIFIDFTSYSEGSIWNFINDLVPNISSTAIQCIISPSTSIVTRSSSLPFTPVQSYTKKNGTRVTTSSNQSLIYAYLHIGSGRIDKTEKYTEKDIQENGCNGVILAWHLLAEIGHKLGHVPKYGA